MEEILSGIKLVKFMPVWKNEAARTLNAHRKKELKYLKGRKYLDALCVYFWATTPVIISILTFATYSYSGNQLTSAKVFASLSLFNMLVTPLNALPWVINGVMEAWVSCERIQKFLNAAEVAEFSYDSSLDETVFVSIPTCCIEECSSGFMLTIPDPIRITEGSLVTVTGKTGSGKTTFLLSLLNETIVRDGEIRFSEQLKSGISYCPHSPWIRNKTIRENILYGKPFQYGLYVKTLFACGLLPDLSSLSPSYDLTIVGDNACHSKRRSKDTYCPCACGVSANSSLPDR